ncbi:MAG: LemA family protein, partial [Bacteroidota bacterium]
MRSKGFLGLLIVLLIVGFAGCAGCGTYNGLVSSQEGVSQAWADVESTYQRRADLIPNLVATVRGAAEFEQETLESVTNARARATSINIDAAGLDDPAQIQAYAEAQRELGGALGRLLAVAENYPQLQATQAFRDLQVQLEGTENRINVARSRYNDAVRAYNTQTRQFPGNLIPGFSPKTPFQADAGAERAP